jgi:hypothetical protein
MQYMNKPAAASISKGSAAGSCSYQVVIVIAEISQVLHHLAEHPVARHKVIHCLERPGRTQLDTWRVRTCQGTSKTQVVPDDESPSPSTRQPQVVLLRQGWQNCQSWQNNCHERQDVFDDGRDQLGLRQLGVLSRCVTCDWVQLHVPQPAQLVCQEGLGHAQCAPQPLPEVALGARLPLPQLKAGRHKPCSSSSSSSSTTTTSTALGNSAACIAPISMHCNIHCSGCGGWQQLNGTTADLSASSGRFDCKDDTAHQI